ncbi:hypothetical protein RMATCC62417_00193 [Rhizopus microsporus]|nr:hypothetical protein RMATCC62417_00193 [Rhizopus microsporus]
MNAFGTSTSQPNVTFGNTANTQSSAGTLFGATPSSNTFGTNPNSSAGILSGTSSNTSAGTLFGTTPNTSTSFGGGFGGFGQKSAAGNTFGATSSAPTGFGQTPATSTGSFSFGANQPAGNAATTTTTATTGGFGSTGFSGFGSFSNPSATTMTTNVSQAKPAFGGLGSFGSNQQQQQQQQIGFGMQNLQQQQMNKPQVQEKVWQELALIRAHFDPTSPLCHFRHYFYNMVPRDEVHLYVRPPNQDENLWNEAIRKNPDPTCLVPVLAVGFDDILKRMEIQSQQNEIYQDKLKEIGQRLASVQREYLLKTLVKLEEHKRRHINLTQRLLRLLRYSQVLRYKNFPLNAEEEKTLEQLNQLAAPDNSPEELHAKMVHLWSRLQTAKAALSDANNKNEVWRSVSEEDTNRIAKVLEDDQQGILHIASILKADTRKMDEIVDTIKNAK